MNVNADTGMAGYHVVRCLSSAERVGVPLPHAHVRGGATRSGRLTHHH